MKKLWSLLILVLYAHNGFSQDSSFRPAFSAVMDSSQAHEILHQCSRGTPDKIKQYWKISDQDVKMLEKNFTKISELGGTGCCVTGFRLGPLKNFGFQYLGVMIKERKYIYINAFPIGEVQEFRKNGHDPSRESVTVCDGGPAFWGALFDIETNQFSELSFNGIA